MTSFMAQWGGCDPPNLPRGYATARMFNRYTVISKSLRPVIRNYVFLLSILSRIQITATAGIFCS